MGGNLSIGSFTAKPLSTKNRTELRDSIKSFIIKLDDLYYKEKGKFFFINEVQFSGSSRFLFDEKIDNDELNQYKPFISDIDLLIRDCHKQDLQNFIYDILNKNIKPDFIIKTIYKHGNETSILIKFGDQYIQIDFVFVPDHLFFTLYSAFLHYSSWEDCKLGIKGVHHKLLLNAIGLDEYKFSITHGLRSRTQEQIEGYMKPNIIGYILFGPNTSAESMYSFIGLVKNISQKIDPDRIQLIIEKYISSCNKIKNVDHEKSINYLKEYLCSK